MFTLFGLDGFLVTSGSDSSDDDIPSFDELNKDAEVKRNPKKPPRYEDLPACDDCGQRYDFDVPEKVFKFTKGLYENPNSTKWYCTKCYRDDLASSTHLSDEEATAVAYYLHGSTSDPAGAAGIPEDRMKNMIDSIRNEVKSSRQMVNFAGQIEWTYNLYLDE